MSMKQIETLVFDYGGAIVNTGRMWSWDFKVIRKSS